MAKRNGVYVCSQEPRAQFPHCTYFQAPHGVTDLWPQCTNAVQKQQQK